MPMVNDPNGRALNISNDGRALTSSITEAEVLHANKYQGQCFSVLVDVTSATTDDDFFYLKNNEEEDLIIYRIEGWCDDANQEIKILLGATDAGTDAGDALTPNAMNAGSSMVPSIDCTQDATDLAITGGSVVDLLKFSTVALTKDRWEYPEGIVVPKSKRLHMEAALAGLINLNIFFYFR